MRVADSTVSIMTTHFSSASARARTALATGLGACLIASAGCHPLVSSGRAPSFLIIDKLEGARGIEPEKLGAFLNSDVLTCKKATAVGESPRCFYYEDPGRVSMRLALKDVGPPESPTEPSTNNLVTVTHYRVVFRRSDGRNQQGLDVPYAFDGGVTFTVDSSGTTAGFTLVRATSKIEAPLLALVGGGGAVGINTTADVTFYGHDQTGSPVTATGSISVNFADWGDPDS